MAVPAPRTNIPGRLSSVSGATAGSSTRDWRPGKCRGAAINKKKFYNVFESIIIVTNIIFITYHMTTLRSLRPLRFFIISTNRIVFLYNSHRKERKGRKELVQYVSFSTIIWQNYG